MNHTKTNRRGFLKSTAGVLGSLSALNCWPSSSARGDEPSPTRDGPAVGCIGVGGRGMAIAHEAARLGRVVAVCDADLAHAERARKKLNPKADVYQDYRKLLDRNDVDVVINGTPDHWHTAVNVAACRAGKDVYTEKPLTLTIDEGKLLRRVVDETGRIVQVGTQQRSEAQFQTAVELVRNGRIGPLKQVWVAIPYCSTKGGPFPKEPVPKQLDWDLYQGQAPEHDYCHQRTHCVFRWWYEYSGGIVTDWGNHHIDIAHWGMDRELSGPASIDARGLFPNEGRADCFNTADSFFSRMIYPDGLELLFFAALGDPRTYGDVDKHKPISPEQTEWLFGKEVPEEIKSYSRNGVMFIGEKGRVFVNRGGVHGKAVDELKENPLSDDAWRAAPSTHHMRDFFECVASRRQPVSPVKIQHRTITACHLTNLSLRLGRPLRWDPVQEEIVGDDEARQWQSRPQREPYRITV
ncbi:MAG: Gfo/Idh/MocA family oxidoreductase [Pirellulales bacterium]|nr:Gfo/Idh/MocA family oxidoreductase [Pirellulales bacterium]